MMVAFRAYRTAEIIKDRKMLDFRVAIEEKDVQKVTQMLQDQQFDVNAVFVRIYI